MSYLVLVREEKVSKCLKEKQKERVREVNVK